LFSQGRKPVDVAEAPLIDEQTAREYFRTFQHKGLDGLMFRSFLGREPYLNSATQAELAHILTSSRQRRRRKLSFTSAKNTASKRRRRSCGHLICARLTSRYNWTWRRLFFFFSFLSLATLDFAYALRLYLNSEWDLRVKKTKN
jgi:hypothetical protein